MKNTMLKYTLKIFAIAFWHTASAQMMGGLMIPSTLSLESQYPPGTVFCSNPTAIVDVTNPSTGKTWMDRNLGASQVATDPLHNASFGDLYQWGRRADGHQCRNSATISTLSSTNQPPSGNFIRAAESPRDWRSPQNANLWQGVNGVNNPCPSGYRLPTRAEWESERASWATDNAAGAIASPLKLPMAGYREYQTGTLQVCNQTGCYSNAEGDYWSSTVGSTPNTAQNSHRLQFSSFSPNTGTYPRAAGHSVRCIKN